MQKYADGVEKVHTPINHVWLWLKLPQAFAVAGKLITLHNVCQKPSQKLMAYFKN